jgi:peroxiredoxin
LVLSAAVTACGSAPDVPPERQGAASTPAASTPFASTPSASPSATGPGAGSSTTSDSATPAATQSPPVPAALSFRANDIEGRSVDGASLAGRDLVLWFWAPWCTVCARSADDVRAAAAEIGDVTFVGVAGLSSDAGAMKDFVRRHEVGTLTHLADTGGDLYTRFGVAQQHTFFLVRADGTVTRHPAYGKDLDLTALVRSTFG